MMGIKDRVMQAQEKRFQKIIKEANEEGQKRITETIKKLTETYNEQLESACRGFAEKWLEKNLDMEKMRELNLIKDETMD